MITVRRSAATGLLAAACVTWAALPLAGAGGIGPVLLAAAAGCAALATARLATAAVPTRRDTFAGPAVRAGRALVRLLRGLPWAEGLVIAALVLEARHPSRPWHTGLLGAALLSYLLAIHLAETGAEARAVRGQVPLIAAGLGLLALAVGAAALPAGQGTTADWMIALAAFLAVVAAGLALPV